jgi:hypothetical protein
MPSIPTNPLELKQFLEDVNEGFLSTKYLALSSFVLLLYDHLICFDQEVRIILVSSVPCLYADSDGHMCTR